MRSFTTILVILIALFVILLVQFNQGLIKVHLTPSKYFEITISFLFLLSAAFGAAVVLIFYVIRDLKNYLHGLQSQRDQKKQSKLQDLYAKGMHSLLSKRNPDATAYFTKVLDINATHVDTLHRLGVTQLRQKNIDEAIRLHQKALSVEGDNPEIMFSLAAAYEEAKRYEDSITVYNDILAKDASNLTALFKMRDLYQVLGRWEDVYETQRQLLSKSLSPAEKEVEQRRLVGVTYEFGRSLLEQGDLEQARKTFRSVLKLDSNFVPAYLGLGEVFLEEDKGKEAAELWEKAYKTTSSIVLLHRLEDFHIRQGDPSRAIEVYTQVVNAKPNDALLKFFLGKLYYRLEMIDEAFGVLSSVDWGDKELSEVHKLLGNIYLRKGSLGLAASEFKKALGFRKQLIIPYTCSSCDHKTTEWSGRCENCGKWNTYGINLEATC